MTKRRLCWGGCGGPPSTPRHHYCDRCREARKRTTAERGYDAAHRRLRARWAKLVERGEAYCARCGGQIDPNQPWDLGHDDRDPTKQTYSGPEHQWCNREAGGYRKGRTTYPATGPRWRSEDWDNPVPKPTRLEGW